MIDIEYTKHVNTYDPVSVAWQHESKKYELDFDEPISALYSEPMEQVIVEVYGENKLNFYSLNGELVFSEKLPELSGYQFRGINKNLKSKTGISFLFHPSDEGMGNEWGDTEQYELLAKPGHRLGKKLGIYR